MRNVGPKRQWGTWEELILGGAVLRHGNDDWYAVASELHARTLFPSYFTPKVCKAKYEDLQKRYSGCTSWVEELRKRRVAELKRELEKSEHSIGSLESMIKRLKDGKINSNEGDCMYGQTQSPASILRSDGNESCGYDGLSAGSFTQDTMTNCSPPDLNNTSKLQVKTGLNVFEPNNNTPNGTPRKRRGKRKRRDCSGEVKEEGRRSFGESENLCSTSLVVSSSSRCNETSTSVCGQLANKSSFPKVVVGGATTISSRLADLMQVFDSFVLNKAAFVFRHRLDSQKRARYKRVIKQHMDFEMIKSRINNNSIKSATELFRDLLLLANNALLFYSKRTKEYKSALSLRDDVLKACRQYYTVRRRPLVSSMSNLPVKTWSARPRSSKRNFSVKIGRGSPYGSLRRINVVDAGMQLQPLMKTNRGLQGPQNMRNGMVDCVPKPPVLKDRKGRGQR